MAKIAKRKQLNQAERDELLRTVVTHDGSESWQELSQRGATDSELQIAFLKAIKDTRAYRDIEGRTLYVSVVLSVPNIWFGATKPPKRQADLSGDGILFAMRRIFKIEMPGKDNIALSKSDKTGLSSGRRNSTGQLQRKSVKQ